MQINYFPFSETAKPENLRKDILKDPKKFVTQKLTGSKFDFGVMEIMNAGAYKEMGYYYVIRPFLKFYVYEQYGQWHDIFALNKTNARKLIGGRIDRIIEVKR